ncbi:MAG: TonB-dependent receptor [Acidobacteriaceae bacterium]|jgi:hypothetical protein|nr:TonB-dependent receptor [Acidobacteriaceae bacterium]
MRQILCVLLVGVALLCASVLAQAQTPIALRGTVRDESGSALPGVRIEWRSDDGASGSALTDEQGRYALQTLATGHLTVSFMLVNFATVRRDLAIGGDAPRDVDIVLHLMFGADVLVTGAKTFTNLADVENPAENLSGVAESASQGAITARQLETRPIERAGEVMETIPGVIVSQHSGEGKANQYYLRGFNLDHGTDFATTVAGMPVNMPTHAHGQGYTDLNFLIPELVGGVQYSKGPYFADQGDFATAGAANINYVNVLAQPIVSVSGGGEGFGRALVAAAPAVGAGTLLAAVEVEHNDGPWDHPDDLQKLNGVIRYTAGTAANRFSLTGMAYHASWNSTDQVPLRALTDGTIDRFGAIDPTDGGDTSRYSASVEWQRSGGNASTRLSAYAVAYDLNLFSNFTYFLNDPVHGDQIRQVDRRIVTGGTLSQKRIVRLFGKEMQNTVGAQVRHDAIGTIGLYHTEARQVLETVSDDSVQETSAAVYAQNETYWMSKLRTIAGLRADGYRLGLTDNTTGVPEGTKYAGLVSPKGGVIVGPFRGVELYGNAGLGFHSNDARAAFATDAAATAPPVSPLVRVKGTEAGLRVVSIPHLQTTVAWWGLWLDSELVFDGDSGTTAPAYPSARHGVEWANYYTPLRGVTFDADLSWSHARFTGNNPAGPFVPGAVNTVMAMGAALDRGRFMGSVRWRYFGPRPLIEDDSVSSKATSLANVQAGYRVTKRMTATVDLFNVTNAQDSDIDYFYTSRLPGEPADGVDDVHLHPALPRTVRASLKMTF